MSPKPNQTELLQAITQTELAHQFAQPVSIQIELAQQKKPNHANWFHPNHCQVYLEGKIKED